MPRGSSTSMMGHLACYFVTGNESGRIFITVLASLPLAFLYRLFARKIGTKYKNIFFIVTGILLYYFNFGIFVVHQIVTVALFYLLFKFLLNPWSRRVLLTVNMVMMMTYLGVCYFIFETEEYDVNFTIPQCLLTLRLIALGFDILDGVKPAGSLSKDQNEAALSGVPPLLELYGFAFMTPAFIVGPIFGFKKYQEFIRGDFDDKAGFLKAAYSSFYYGMIYIFLRQLGTKLIPKVFFLSTCLKCSSSIQKAVYVSLLGKTFLWKYAGIWLLSESALITFGIGYGPTQEGVVSDWAGCRNVNIRLFDLDGIRLNHYILSMNMMTNKWASNYIYKRLKFLRSKLISFAITCMFLAAWHGYHTGYYVSFALEFLVINFEKEFELVFNQVIASRFPRTMAVFGVFIYLFLRIYNVLMFGICVIPFLFLNYDDWAFVYCNISDLIVFVTYGYGIAFGLLIFLKIVKRYTS